MSRTASHKRSTEHPALPLMRREAQGHLVRFQTDLTVHDAAALARHNHRDAFAWVLHSGATWLVFMGTKNRGYRFAQVFVNAYGDEDTRFYFWDGAVLVQYPTAGDLDRCIAAFEKSLRLASVP